MAKKESPLIPLLVLGGVAYALWGKAAAAALGGATPPEAASPLPLRAGVPYLFILRLEASDESATTVLSQKGVTGLEFTPAENPPFWAQPGETYSTRLASFMVTPNGNATVSLGDPFYGIGRIERLIRLDGQALAAPGGVA